MKAGRIVVILLLSVKAASSAESAENFLKDYIEAVVSEDYSRAETFWSEKDLQQSQRLGISYLGAPLKIDTASPVFNTRNHLKNGVYFWQIKQMETREDVFRVTISVSGGAASSDFVYYIQSDMAEFKLVSPFSQAQTKWRHTASEYVNIYYEDESLFHPYALSEADRFINTLAKDLAISPERMELLGKEKIDYYLCSAETVRKLTGFEAQGMANLQFDAVISRQLPHLHELTHLMVNFALQELPLYTLPLLQEGAAAGFGGRWGKSPEVILQLGEFYLREEWLQPESVFNYQEFHKLGADMSYPLAALWTKYLRDELGGEKFRELYLTLSGTSEQVVSLTMENTKSIFNRYLYSDWKLLIYNFWDSKGKYKYSGLLPVDTIPAGCESVYKYRKSGRAVYLYQDRNYYYLEAELGEAKQLGIFLQSRFKQIPYRSWMFAEQFPQETYMGEEMGIVVSAGEAGIYDYTCNVLKAKLTQVFQGNEGFENDGKTIRCKFSRSLWRKGEMKGIMVE